MRAVGVLAAVLLSLGAAQAGELRQRTEDVGPTFAMEFKAIGGRSAAMLNKDCVEQAKAVCSYNLDDFGMLIATGAKRKGPSEEITVICQASDGAGVANCVNAYLAVIKMTAPAMSKDGRGSIISAMLKVLDVSDDTRMKTDGVEYILQKVPGAGLWFHAKATN